MESNILSDLETGHSGIRSQSDDTTETAVELEMGVAGISKGKDKDVRPSFSVM